MAKAIDAIFTAEKNKQANQPIILFTLFAYDGANDLNLVDAHDNVDFDGVTYSAFPIKFETIPENSQGEVDAIKIKVANVSRVFESYLQTYDLREKKVRVRIVWANQLDETGTYLDYVFYIEHYSSNANSVELVCTTKTDVVDYVLPTGLYLRTHCRYKNFKDPQTCGYAGAEDQCNRTFQRCRVLNNQIRFGGFPSIPTRRIYIV